MQKPEWCYVCGAPMKKGLSGEVFCPRHLQNRTGEHHARWVAKRAEHGERVFAEGDRGGEVAAYPAQRANGP